MKMPSRFNVPRPAPLRNPWDKSIALQLLRRHGRGPSQHGYLMMEALVYIGLVMALLGVGYAAMYRCMDNSIALRRTAEDITRTLQAGERWRADVRAAHGRIRLDNANLEPTLYLPGPVAEVAYRLAAPQILRRAGAGPWVPVLANVKTSTMTPDPRSRVTAWRWELELQPRGKGVVKPGHTRPLFTFLAVPQSLILP
jgi:hypothetical protein